MRKHVSVICVGLGEDDVAKSNGQNAEIVLTLSEPRSLHDRIDYSGKTTEFLRNRREWDNVNGSLSCLYYSFLHDFNGIIIMVCPKTLIAVMLSKSSYWCISVVSLGHQSMLLVAFGWNLTSSQGMTRP